MKLKLKEINAPLWKRAVAYIIDIFVINLIIISPFNRAFDNIPTEISSKGFIELYNYFLNNISSNLIISLLIMALLSVLYWTVLEFKIGQSVGKLIMHIYVVPEKKEFTFFQVFIRNISKISSILLALDSLYLIFGYTGQRYFDKIAKTKVVEKV